MGCSTTGQEDRTSPSSRGCFSPGQFDILASDSGYGSDRVELSAAAVKSPVIAKFDQSNYTMEPKSGTITRPEASCPRKEFAAGRQQPIMSCQQPTKNRQQPITSCQDQQAVNALLRRPIMRPSLSEATIMHLGQQLFASLAKLVRQLCNRCHLSR